nr:DUF1054 family protein [Paenibacillus taichungensis]
MHRGKPPFFHDITDAKWRCAEVMCGLRVDRDDPLAADRDKFLETVRSRFKTLLPLYKMSMS